MSSREEEKRKRREERLAAERAEASRGASRRRLLLAGGGTLAVAAIAAIAILALGSGSSNGDKQPEVPIPARQIADLAQAAKAAGCVVKTFPSEGRTHLPSDSAVNNGYKTNPPTSGDHRPVPAEDGIYAPGNEPDKENWVHSLEHGRIIYQYAPGTPARRIAQLETLFNEPFRGVTGYHQLLFRNNTKMQFAVAAVAWTHYAACTKFTDKTFDVFRAFRERYVDKGPELIA